MRKALLRTFAVVSLFAILLSTVANETKPVFTGLRNDAPKAALDATYHKTQSELAVKSIKQTHYASALLGPVFTSCPTNISVSNDIDICGAVVNFPVPIATEPSRDTSVTIPYSKTAIDSFIVPNGVTSITIRAVGAAGGNRGNTMVTITAGGRGASMQGTFAVIPGQKLYYLIGQKGGPFTNTGAGGGGGGATFVSKESTFLNTPVLLLAAAGGGGASMNNTGSSVADGNITLEANNGADPGDFHTPGDGGGANSPSLAAVGVAGAVGVGGGGGAGWTLNGQDATHGTITQTGGKMPSAWAVLSNTIPNNGRGGLGGGGTASGAGGGGGGFNGGGGGARNSGSTTDGSFGGGGGSLNNGTNQENKKGSDIIDNAGLNNGQLTFSWTITPVVTVTQTAGLPSGSVFPVGTTVNTFVATNDIGLTATCSFTVTVTDTQAPLITAPTNVTVNVDPNSCIASNVLLGSPIYSDNCPGVTVANNAPSVFPIGNTTVTWTAKDGVNLTATATQIVTVVDNIPPIVICPADISVDAGSGSSAVITYPAVTGTDNCGTPSLQYSIPSGSTFNVGTTIVTITATDAAGLTSTCSFNVTVTGSAIPEIDVVGNNNSIASGDVTPSVADNTDFGSTTVGNNIVKIFSVRNTGTGPLTISGIGSGGAGVSKFALSGLPVFPVTLPSGGSFDLTVTFNSSTPGTFPMTITVYSDDTDESVYTYDVIAEAVCTSPVITGTPNVCVGGTTGLATLAATAPSGAWSSSNPSVATVNNGLVTGYSQGTTVISVTALNGCTGSITVTVNAQPDAPTVSGTLTICSGTSTTISAFSSLSPQTFKWYTVPTGGDPIFTGGGLTTGALTTTTTYYVEVNNGPGGVGGCTSARVPVTVTVNALPTAAISGTTTACGSVTLTASGGISYLWSGGNTPSSATNTFNSSGTYSVTVTNANNCNANASAIVTVLTAISGTLTSTDPTCVANGTIAVSNAQGAANSTVLSADFSSLPSGAIFSGTATVTGGVLQLNPPQSNTSGYIAFAQTTSTPSAFNASFDFRIADGNGADGFSFSYGVINPIYDYENSIVNPGLAVGFSEFNSTVIVRYNGGYVIHAAVPGLMNTSFRNVTVSINASNQITVSIAGSPVITNHALPAAYASVNKSNWKYGFAARSGGQNNRHSIDNVLITASTPLEYSINGTTWQTSNIFSVPAGTYTVQARLGDGSVCGPQSIGTITLTTPTAPSAPTGTNGTRCGTGTVNLSASAGAGQTIDWYSDATGGTLLASGPNYTTTSISSTTIYYAEARNTTTNCVSATRAPVTATVNVVATPTFTQVGPICAGTSLSLPSLSNNGVTGSWSPAINNTATTTYTFTPTAGVCATTTTMTVVVNPIPSAPSVAVVDNCDGTSTLSTTATGSLLWSTGETTSTITVNSAGYYSVTTSVNGCTSLSGTGSASPKTTPSAPSVSVVDNCDGTSTFSTTATGSLLWSTGETTSSITVNTAGYYSVTTSVNGCTSLSGTGSASPKTTPSAPSVSVVDNCDGTSTLSTTATGSLLWSTGETTSSITVNSAGYYSVTTSVNGCTSLSGTGSASPKTTPSAPSVSVVDNCDGTSTLSTTATGSLLWSTGETTSTITVNSAGYYSVTTSVNGCTSLSGTGSASPKTTPSAPSVSVVDNCDGTSTLSTTATGSLLWSTGETTSSITVNTAGYYSVTTSVNGCTSLSGTGSASPKTTPSAPSVSVVDNCDGTSTLSTTATGSLLWSTGETTSSITVNSAGYYSVTTSVNGCTSLSGTGSASPKTTPSAPSVSVVDNCDGTSTLSTTATGSLLWSTGETTSSITVNTAGYYSVTTSVNGCTSLSGTGSASPKTAPSAPSVSVVDNCDGTSTLSTTATGSLLWSTGETTSSITVNSAGSYSVTTSVNGCTSLSGTGSASPKTTPATPSVAVVDNCDGTSTLSTTATGSLLWSTGETTSSITVNSAGSYSVTTSVNGCTSLSGTGSASPKTAPTITQGTGNKIYTTEAGTCSVKVVFGLTYGMVYTLGSPAGMFTYELTGATTGSGAGTASGTIFNKGITHVKYTLANSCGSVSTSYDITVEDKEKPTITAPANITADAGPSCYTSVTLGTPVTGDNCGVLTVTSDAPSVFPIGNTTVTWTVTDVNNNTNTATQVVTVTDNTKPNINCPADITLTANTVVSDVAGRNITYTATATDNCGVPSISYSPASGSFFAIGTHTILVTSVDDAGNVATCTFNVTVNPKPIDAVDDDYRSTPINGAHGGTTPVILVNDLLDNAPVNISQVDIMLTMNGGITGVVLNPNGTITIPAGTMEGDYMLGYSICEKENPSNCDQATVWVRVARGLAVTTTAYCNNDVPYLHYKIVPNFTTTGSPVTITWFNGDMSPVAAQTVAAGMPLEGDILWPGAVLDNLGQPIDWPGWYISNGVWVQGADGFEGTRPFAYVQLSVNPTEIVQVSYPPATPGCTAQPFNRPPVANPDTKTIEKCGTAVINVVANDTDFENGPLTVTSISTPAHGTVVNNGDGTITYIPVTGFVGTDVFSYTITDAAGNTASTTVAITVEDTIAPVAPTLTTINGECGATVPVPVATDGCSGTITGTTSDPLTYTAQGVYTVNWIFTDGSNNSSYATQTVVVKDVTKPLLNCPGDITLTANTIVATVSGAFASYTATATDNCSTPDITYSIEPGSFFPIGTTPVTVTAKDAVGNTVTCTFNVIVNCVLPTVTSCQADKVVNTDAGVCTAAVSYGVNFNLGLPEAAVSYTFSGATTGSGYGTGSGATFNTGVTTVTVTATNSCGSVSCSFTITVEDNEKPTITAPPTVTVNANANCQATGVNLGTPTTGDNCGVLSVTNNAPSVFPIGNTIVTWTVTDVNNNTNTATQVVTVADNTKPNIYCPGNITVDANTVVSTMSGSFVSYTATATDNCGTADITYSVEPGSFFQIGTTTVTVTAKDAVGNTVTCTFNVIVKCVLPAVTTCASNMSVTTDAGVCTAKVNYGVSFNLGLPEGTVSYTFSGATTGSGAGTGSGATFNTGVTTVTVTATNSCGSVSCSFTITVEDKEKPTITAPPTVTVNADANCQATGVNLGTPTTGDNCGVLSVTNDAPSVFPIGNTTVTWTVTDVNNNTNTATQVVTVADNTKPNIYCPGNITVDANTVVSTMSGSFVSYTATATDNCGTADITYSVEPGSFFQIGTTTVTVTAKDAVGNTVTCTFDVTVKCVLPTVTSCQTDKVVNTDAGVCTAAVSYGVNFNLGLPEATVSYTFSGATTGSGYGTGSGAIFNKGVTTVTVTATNSCGSVSCSFTITVEDKEKPTITAPAPVTVNANANCQATGVNLGTPTTGDNCGVLSVTNNAPSVFPIGSTTVTWTVTDVNNNTNTATQVVTVVDNTKPNIYCPGNITLTANTVVGTNAGVYASYTATATDNCSTPVITYSIEPGSFFQIGTTPVTVTAKDAAGNTITCTFNVTVNCVPPTVISCSSDKTVNTDATKCSAVVNYTASFNLGLPEGSVSYTFSGATTGSGAGTGSGAIFNTGVTTVTVTAGNICGTVSCSFTITVEDKEKPTITAPAPVTVDANANCQATGVNLGTPTTGDNCGVLSVGNNAPSVFPIGSTTVTWTVTDVNNNINTATQVVTVIDNTKPTVNCPSDIVLTANTTVSGVAGSLATYAATATDNCGTAVISYSIEPGSFFAIGTTPVTVTATDAKGNISTCTFNVTVNCVKPVFTSCPSAVTANTVTTACSAPVSYTVSFNAGLPAGALSYVLTGATTGSGSGSGSGINFNKGVTTVTVTATNICGSVSKSFTVIVADNVPPVIVSCPANTSVYCGGSTLPGATGTATATDNCGSATVTYTDLVSGNIITRTWTATDAAGNTSSCQQTINTGGIFTATVASIPTSSTYTGGVSTNLFIGYGAQSTKLQVNVPSTGGPYTYAWSGSATGMLSSTTSSAPIFTPTAGSSYTFTVVVTNSYGCSSTATITICVTDIRVMSSNDGDEDDEQYNCDHRGHDYSDCSHRGHGHSCNHRSHSKYDCSHRHDGDDDDDRNCDHRSHSSNDCSHRGHGHNSCSHRSHSSNDCEHSKRSHGSSQKMCDHRSHSSRDCNHNSHHHNSCNHNSHNSNSCPHNGGDNDNGQKVYICHVPPGNPNNPLTLSISVNAVADHLANHSGDRLGSCSQTPCSPFVDTEKPEIDCPAGVTVNYGSSTAPSATGSATASDNSNVVTITYTDASTKGTNANSTSFYNYTITRTWKAADAAGNFETCTQLITVKDVTKPVITCPATTTVTCGDLAAPSATGTATATDNSAGPIAVTYSDYKYGTTITRTWKATDISGNYATCTQTISVVDNIKPTITCPANTTVSCGASTAPNYCGNGAYATATDNCDNNVAISYSDAKTGNVITRTWKATDDAGNFNTCTQTITIIDNVKPVITCPGNITVSCSSNTTPSGCNSEATARDNCDNDVDVTYSDVENGNIITRTWTATDDAGNVSTCVQKITVVDNVKPVLTEPNDVTVACSSSTNPSATGMATATDNCSTPVITYADVTSGNKITRTWKATDASGNYITDVQIITINDNVKPVLTEPNDITINCGTSTAPSATGTATATDNCSGVTITYNDVTSGNKITRTWKATDVAGNYITDVQIITIVDAVKPTVNAPANTTISCGASTLPSSCGGNATGADNCSAVTITYSDSKTGNAITRTWKATDASGNFATDAQTITIIDNVKPVISCPGNITVSCGSNTTPSGCNSQATATDNCDNDVDVSYSDVTSGNVITRTWTATDAAGNFSTCIQKITVIDNVKPSVTDVADATVNCGASTAPSATGTATGSDNCSAASISYSDVTSGNLIVRTWKATDASGNYATSTQRITVGVAFSPNISSVPTNSTYTGGVSTNLYLGYGAQSTKLEVCALPSSGAPYTYTWTGSATNRLNSTTSAAPVFTPNTFGSFTFTVTVKNKYGCTYTDVISICVTDIRVPGCNGTKVYVCDKGRNKWGQTVYQTLQVPLSQVSSYINSSSCDNGDARLGSCDQTPCNYTSVNASSGGTVQSTTSEAPIVKAVTTEEELKITVMPNPSTTFFTLKLESRYETPVNLRVMDGNGRVVDAKSKLGANSTFQIGHSYSSGTYYAEFIQGGTRKVVQLIKAKG